MKKLKILNAVIKRTGANKLIISFVVLYVVIAFLIWIVEPGITSFGDALWYNYAVFSTAGFGDLIVTTLFAKILSVILTIATLLVVALVTGVIVAFYNDVVSMKYKATKAQVMNDLEHLDELSKEQLRALSAQIKKIM